MRDMATLDGNSREPYANQEGIRRDPLWRGGILDLKKIWLVGDIYRAMELGCTDPTGGWTERQGLQGRWWVGGTVKLKPGQGAGHQLS